MGAKSLFNCATTTYSLSCSADFLDPCSKFHSALRAWPLIRHKQGHESMASGLLGPREGLEQPENSRADLHEANRHANICHALKGDCNDSDHRSQWKRRS